MIDSVAPPNNVEAEEALLGSLIIDTDAIFSVSDSIAPSDFYREHNRWIYEAMLSLSGRHEPVDLITLTNELKKKNRLEQIGGESYVIGLINTVPTSINTSTYAKIVKSASVRRKMLNAANTMANIAIDEDSEIEEQISAASAVVMDLDKESADNPIKDPAFISSTYLDHLDLAAQDEGGMTGLETGFRDLDMFLRGLQPTLYVVAGRPGMGKSSMLINIAEHVAICLRKRVLLFSLEMNSNQVVQRIVAHRTGINLQDLKAAKLNPEQWRQVHGVVNSVNESGLFIDETPGIRVSQCFSRAMRMHAQEPLDLIMYDHLHLMSSDKYEGNPVKEVGEITKVAFGISKALGVPSIMAAQLSRAVEDRKDKRPTLRDLRDSGEIEQNAFGVIFPYREEYYYPGETDKKGLIEISIAKNRDGPTGVVEMLWHSGTASFNNITRRVM